MANNGGALPSFEEPEQLRSEGGIPVRRFVRRLGIPSSTWYYWRTSHMHGRPVRTWPAPVVDALAERTIETAHKYSAWGHRKIWAMLRADGVDVSVSSVERTMRRANLLQPRRYLAERRALAARRKEVFLEPPARRNRVWQIDFTEFETTGHRTWRILVVVDYATKVCLAAAISGTSAARDAIESLEVAIVESERLLGHPLVDDASTRPRAIRSSSRSSPTMGRRSRARGSWASSPAIQSCATCGPAITPPRPRAWSSASTGASSTSTGTGRRSPTSSNCGTRSRRNSAHRAAPDHRPSPPRPCSEPGRAQVMGPQRLSGGGG